MRCFMDKMLVILWEMLFSILFLIVLCLWFTRYHYVRYENMRNEKSFLVECQVNVFLYDINWINRQSMFFSVKIVCLIDIYFYFCHSLLSSEGSSFLIILLRTVICCILYKNPLIFYQWMTMSDRSRALLHIYFVIYTIGRGAITYVHWGS